MWKCIVLQLVLTILQQSCNNHATILQVGHSTCEKSVTILKQSCNNLTTIFQDVLGRLPMATDPMIMSSTLIESQKSIIYTPTTTLLTLYSIFARLLTILQNIKQSFWTLISSQYRFFSIKGDGTEFLGSHICRSLIEKVVKNKKNQWVFEMA